jgi:hypothetical protein
MKKYILFFLFIYGFGGALYAQDTITNTDKKQKKNTIRWNITPMVINTSNITLGYERILKKNQSISINAGLLLFPEFLNNDSLKISYVEHGNRVGFTTAMDYRFYLGKRNKNSAPDGVYIGPYITYYQYAFDSKLRFVDNDNIINDLGVDASFKMASLGLELGYQFLFWDRMTVDLILVGPSVSYYSAKVSLTGELGIEDDGDLRYIKDQILEKYPWMDTFIELDAINTKGGFDSFAMGFRYVVQVGYHF